MYNEELYLYFRTQPTVANDDAESDSCLFPLSSFAGYEATAASGVNKVKMYFKSMQMHDGADYVTNGVVVSDAVVISLKAGSTPKDFIEDMTKQLNVACHSKNKFLNVADDRDLQYVSTHIAEVGAIGIAAVAS